MTPQSRPITTSSGFHAAHPARQRLPMAQVMMSGRVAASLLLPPVPILRAMPEPPALAYPPTKNGFFGSLPSLARKPGSRPTQLLRAWQLAQH